MLNKLQNQILNDPKSKIKRYYIDGGPGCFGDSGGPAFRRFAHFLSKLPKNSQSKKVISY